MRLLLHIFRKDARRLAWEAGVAAVMLLFLMRQDWWRADFVPGAMEGWLNLLVPLAWAYLVVLVVHEEPLVGDDQFWITRPYSPPALLGAKALFVLVFIHLASFLADGTILAVRGFQPLAYLPQLLWKQVMLAMALTLPAAALAAVVRNLAHFMLGAIVIAAAAVYLEGRIGSPVAPFLPFDAVRRGLPLLVVAALALAIVWLQYARRRTVVARLAGIAALLIAAALYAWVPRSFTAAVECALSPAPLPASSLSLRVEPERTHQVFYSSPGRTVSVVIPIAFSGVPEGVYYRRLEQIALDVIAAGGERIAAGPAQRPSGPERPPLIAYFSREPSGDDLLLDLERSIFERLRGGKVTLAGKAGATFYRSGVAVSFDVGTRRDVPGVGMCSTVMVEDRWRSDMLKVVCECPAAIAPLTPVDLVSPDGRAWRRGLGDSGRTMAYPARAWLSPLNRLQTFFTITDRPAESPSSQWLVPRADLAGAKLTVTPQVSQGSAVIEYRFPDLSLDGFVVRP